MTREEAIWWVNHLFEIRKEEYFNKGMMEDAKELEEAQRMAIEALSAEAVRGEWLITEHGSNENGFTKWNELECSICGFIPVFECFEDMKFCPNCGAKMDGERGDNANTD